MAVDWSIEWFTSTVWILGVTVAAGLACWLIVWLLARSTAWGRQFARLAFPYFSPRGPQGWRPLVVLLLLLLLTIASVRLTVLFSYVNNDLFTALQQLDPSGFLRAVLVFLALAAVWVVNSLLAFYVQQWL